jgi:hypothetical protein
VTLQFLRSGRVWLIGIDTRVEGGEGCKARRRYCSHCVGFWVSSSGNFCYFERMDKRCAKSTFTIEIRCYFHRSMCPRSWYSSHIVVWQSHPNGPHV